MIAEIKAYFKIKKLLKEATMKNWKTTASGVLAAIGQVLPYFGFPQEVSQAVSVIGLFLIGLFAKDSNVTGGTVVQPSN
jgi:hypothetical protein